MKKTITLLITVMLLVLAACRQEPDATPATAAEAPVVEEATVATAPESERSADDEAVAETEGDAPEVIVDEADDVSADAETVVVEADADGVSVEAWPGWSVYSAAKSFAEVVLTDNTEAFDIMVNVHGGGQT